MSDNFIMTEDWLTEALADSIDIDWRSRDGARAILKALFDQNVGVPSPSGQYRSVTVERLDSAILAKQEITWRGTEDEQYEARINACCSRRAQWPAQNCPRDGSCDDCWHDMVEALKVPAPLPDGFVHPDDFAREYQASLKARAVCGFCNGTGYQLSGFSQTPSDRMCLACNKADPDYAYWQSCQKTPVACSGTRQNSAARNLGTMSNKMGLWFVVDGGLSGVAGPFETESEALSWIEKS